MKHLEPTTWEHVFAGWREREASDPGWIRCATQLKGWSDWESWRMYTANQLNLPNRSWERSVFTDPADEIPNMLMGPYSGWQSRVPAKNTHTFADLLAIPEQRQWVKSHEKIQSILQALPFASELIGLRREDTGTIICIEGHHRAAAVAQARLESRRINFSETPITIAFASLAPDEIPLLDRALERGSSHPTVHKG